MMASSSIILLPSFIEIIQLIQKFKRKATHTHTHTHTHSDLYSDIKSRPSLLYEVRRQTIDDVKLDYVSHHQKNRLSHA